jgi:WD40 repeat protein
MDGSVSVWDVLNAVQPIHRFTFGIGSTTQLALFNPRFDEQKQLNGQSLFVIHPPLYRNDNQVLVYLVLQNGVCTPPIVKNLATGQETRLPSIGHRSDPEEPICAATFDRRGQYIITGSTKGLIVLYDSKSLKSVAHCRQQGNQQQVIHPSI